MQKKIIALAVAAVASSAAFAQSNVTVSGRADVYAAGVTNSAGTKAAAVNSGGLGASFLKFNGVEDLGGGTKALFTLEYGLAMDDNTGVGATSSAARQQFVGLSGDYGTIIGGRLQTLIYNHNAAFNPTFGTAVDTLASVGTSTTRIGGADRANNAVAYVAPAIGNVTLAGAYVANYAATDVAAFSTTTRAYQVSGMYANGPLKAGVVYDTTLDNVAGPGNKSYALGASYDLGVATVMANIGHQEANKNADNTKRNLYNLAAVAPVSAKGAVIVSYATSKIDGTDGEAKRNAYTLAYKHGLSKRTALYGGFAQAQGDSNNPSGTFGGISPVTSGGNDGKVNVVFAGVQHLF